MYKGRVISDMVIPYLWHVEAQVDHKNTRNHHHSKANRVYTTPVRLNSAGDERNQTVQFKHQRSKIKVTPIFHNRRFEKTENCHPNFIQP